MSCGIVLRLGLDPKLMWLWYRSAAIALIQPLAWEPPYAAGLALKRQKEKKEKKEKKKKGIQHCHKMWYGLWLWLRAQVAVAVARLAAIVPIRPLAWELPYVQVQP